MITERFLMGRGRDTLDADELETLESAATQVRDLSPGQILVRRGQRVPASTLLVSGFMCRYMDDRDGRRQLVAVHVPGDFVDLHGFPMRVLDHDIAALGPARVALMEHQRLFEITETLPRLTRMLWFSTLLDAAMHREWIFRLGRLGAEGRIAHLFCELEERLHMVGLATDGRFALPMTQSDIGEACGLTGVHVNRVLRRLRESGQLQFASGQAAILDRRGLRRTGEFEGDYLYGGGEWVARDA